MKKIWDLFLLAVKGTEEDLTAISLNRAIVLLSVPMILEMVMESLFAVVDAYFVAKVSIEAVTTVGLTESVLFLIYAVSIGLSMAATAMVSRRVGENEPKKAAISASQAIILAVILSLVTGALGFTFAENVLEFMGAEPEVVASGVGYTRIMFGGNLVIMLLFLLNGIFRGVGNASLAMRTLWISNGLNMILDPCLIFGWGFFPEMGVQGAAVATNIGRGVAVVFQLYLLFSGTGIIKLVLKYFIPRKDILLSLINVASGGTGQYLISSASWMFLMRIVAFSGKEVVAGYTIAIRLIIFAILPAWGMANAAATLVGQNLGAKQPDRAEKSVWRTAFYAMVFLLGVSVSCFFLAPWLISFFHQDPAVVDAGVTSLRIICSGYVFFAYGIVISTSLNGAGDTRTPTWINFICFWLIQLPLAYTFALFLGYEAPGVYWAVLITELVFAGVCIWVFRQGKWKLVEI